MFPRKREREIEWIFLLFDRFIIVPNLSSICYKMENFKKKKSAINDIYY